MVLAISLALASIAFVFTCIYHVAKDDRKNIVPLRYACTSLLLIAVVGICVGTWWETRGRATDQYHDRNVQGHGLDRSIETGYHN